MCDRESIKMSVAASLYKKLEDREAVRTRLNKPELRRHLSRVVKAAPGTLKNLVSGRLKRAEYLEASIKAAFVKSLEAEIAHLLHEVEMARRCGSRPDCDEILQAETLLAQAKELIRG